MTELNEKLKEDLLENFFQDTLDTTWVKGKPDFDLDFDLIEILIEPEDAEKINEIEYFTVIQNISGGSIQTDYKRQS